MNKKIIFGLIIGLSIAGGVFIFSKPASACACGPEPEQVTGLTFSVTDVTQGTLSWTDPFPNDSPITDYVVVCSLYGDGSDPFVNAYTFDTATSSSITGLTSNRIYQCTVGARSLAGTGPISEPLIFATGFTNTYADPLFATSSNSYTKFVGMNVFPTIQSAINAVEDGGYVYATSTTFTENITLDRGISLSGQFDYPDVQTLLVAPDCGPVVTLNSTTSVSFFQAFDIDADDAGHHCSAPAIYAATSSETIGLYVTVRNANTALQAASSSFLAFGVVNFISDATGVDSQGTGNLLYFPYSYWGSDTGPAQSTTNPSGTGAAIIGPGGPLVDFRPFIDTDVFSPGSNLMSPPPFAYDHVQDLFHNGGSFIAFGSEPLVIPPLNDVSDINVTDRVTINVPANGSSTTVYINGFPSFFFTSGYTISAHDGLNFDASQISATSTATSSATGLPHGLPAVGTILQFGIPGRELDVTSEDSDPVQIGLYVGQEHNGHTLAVVRSESLSSGWTQRGLYDATCEVDAGYCTFRTNRFSYFAAVDLPDGSDKIYVNTETGDDTTGTGASSTPYKTFTKAYDESVSGDTIHISGTVDWSNPDEVGSETGLGFTITHNLTIEGDGAVVTAMQASSTVGTADRSVLTIAPNVAVTIKNILIRYGMTTAPERGGGITDRGTLTLENAIVDSNRSDISIQYFSAGGIYARVSTGDLTIASSTISNNGFIGRLYGAGGVFTENINVYVISSTFDSNSATSSDPTGYPYSYAEPAGGLRLGGSTGYITNSTFYNNQTNSYAGAISITNGGPHYITNSTIVNNNADAGGGGIVYNMEEGHSLNLKNNFIANNTGESFAGDDLYVYDVGSATHVTDNGYNLIEFPLNITLTNPTDFLGDHDLMNPQQLGLAVGLDWNDSNTMAKTLALTSDSMAINAGDNGANGDVAVPSFDARGFYRNGRRDIGAYEFDGTTTPPTGYGGSLTEISGPTGRVRPADAKLYYSVSGDVDTALAAGHGQYLGEECVGGNAELIIDQVNHIASMRNLSAGITYSCAFEFQFDDETTTNSLTIGPFTVTATHSSGGVANGGGAGGSYIVVPTSSSTAPAASSTQVGTNGNGGAGLGKFTRRLYAGLNGDDVKALQVFLNGHGFPISDLGPGSKGNETTKFGAKTKAALKKFQEAHATDILTPQGLKKGNGVFGPATMKFINSLLGQ